MSFSFWMEVLVPQTENLRVVAALERQII